MPKIASRVSETLATAAFFVVLIYWVAHGGHLFGQVTGWMLIVSGIVSTVMMIVDWIGFLGILLPLGYVLAGIYVLNFLPAA